MGPKIRLTTKDDDYPIIYRVFNHPRWLVGILSINSRITCLRQLDERQFSTSLKVGESLYFLAVDLYDLWCLNHVFCWFYHKNHGFLMFTFSFFFVSEVFFFGCCCNALIIQRPKKHLNKPWAVWISKNPVRILCLKHIKHLKSRRHFVFSSYHRNPREFWCPHNQIPPIKSVWRRHDATRQNRFDLMMYLAFFPKCRYSRL